MDEELFLENLASYIDHTLLKGDLSNEEIKRVCDEAVLHSFRSICIYPEYISLAANYLKDQTPMIVSVVDFPYGSSSINEKANLAKEAVNAGADEIDMVINHSYLKEKKYDKLYQEIHEVVKASYPRPIKVILEMCELTYDEKVISCSIAKAAKAHFVKTSTGLGRKGASISDVILMRKIIGNDMQIKASGGIRSFDQAIKMVKAGATRLGTSASLAIIKEIEK